MRRGIWAAGLLLCLAAALLAQAFAADAVFSLEAPRTPVQPGETFQVTVSLADNPGYTALQYTLVFDKSQMDCTGITLGPAAAGEVTAVNPEAADGARIAVSSAHALEAGGVVAVYTFTARRPITVFSFQADRWRFRDQDRRDLGCTLTGFTLADPLPEPTETPAPSTEPEPTETPAPSTEPEPTASPGETAEPSGPSPTPEPTATEPPAPSAEPGPPFPSPLPEPSPGPLEVTEPPEPTPEPATPPVFSDIDGHWARPYIEEAVAAGLFQGYPDGSFGPEDPITRAQLVAVLYRMARSPEPDAAAPFLDLESQSPEFRRAIDWAYGQGWINGKTGEIFDPDGPLTRQEAVKILFQRSGGQSGMERMFTAIYDDTFTDSAALADWAKPAMYWGVCGNG